VQDRKPVPLEQLQSFLGVSEVLFARVLGELQLKGSDDSADVALGAPVISCHEDHAVMPGTARHDCLDVERAEVAHVVGDDGSLLRSRESQL
jgi:hypothetical protein